jgi:hypothetical protein
VREDRLVAGHGFSSGDIGGREHGRMRGWVGPTEKYLGPGRDKGHVFGRALGGRVDGLEINLFSQARALNRGWSEEQDSRMNPNSLAFLRRFPPSGLRVGLGCQQEYTHHTFC